MYKTSQTLLKSNSHKSNALFPSGARPLLRGDAKKRHKFLGLLFSPAFALSLAFFGYYSFAGFVNFFLPKGDLGSILIRSGILIFIAISFLRTTRISTSVTRLVLLPVILFLLAYFMRLIENIYLADIYIPPGPRLILPIFVFSGIATAFALSRIVHAIRDEDFTIVLSGLCIIFLAGMALNIDVLMQSAEHRMMLEKINPISMAHLAFAFLIYYLLVFSRSKRLAVEAAVITPVLLLIVVYAQSRGAYIAGAGAIAIYILLLKGTRRVWLLVGLSVVGLIVAYTAAIEHFEIAIHALQRIDIYNDASTHGRYISFYGAWEQFNDNFAFGQYAVERTTGYYPHNIYLESLMAVGFIGTIPFAIHLMLAIRAAAGIIRTHRFSIAPVLVSILFFREAIASMASGSLWGNTGFWITSILVIVFWYGQPRCLKRSMRPGFKARPQS